MMALRCGQRRARPIKTSARWSVLKGLAPNRYSIVRLVTPDSKSFPTGIPVNDEDLLKKTTPLRVCRGIRSAGG